MFGPNVPPVSSLTLVISLPGSSRRAQFARGADTALEWRFFDASRELAPDLRYDEGLAIAKKGRPLTPAELGAYASHFSAWVEFLASDRDQLLVLEDDALVDWRYVERLLATNLAALDVHFLRLFYGNAEATRPVGHLGKKRLMEALGYQFGGVGYVLTRPGAEILVTQTKMVSRPVDDEMDRTWAHGLRKYLVYPPAVMEAYGASTIEPVRFEKFRVPRRMLLARCRHKFGDKMRRVAHMALSAVRIRPNVTVEM